MLPSLYFCFRKTEKHLSRHTGQNKKRVNMNLSSTAKTVSGKRLSDLLFILWAGGAALLSYSLVYALRKPYTAAAFEGLEFFHMDYKVAVTIVQILGYLIAKFAGIKLISELKKETRFRFIVLASILAELALVGFWLLPAPYNLLVMFFNGLALGCMWGVIFSFIEGRRVTDLLASMLGVSIVFSSGTAKSIGLFVMNTLHIDQFLMPALIGGAALPLLLLLGYSLSRLPQPDEHDIASKSKRETLNGKHPAGDSPGHQRRFLSEYLRRILVFLVDFRPHRQHCHPDYIRYLRIDDVREKQHQKPDAPALYGHCRIGRHGNHLFRLQQHTTRPS